MKISSNIKKSHFFESVLTIFIIVNLLVFIGMFFTIRANLYLAVLLLLMVIIWHRTYVSIILNKKHIIFIIFVLSELISHFNLLFYPLSRNFVSDNPSMIFQGLSYLLIPQFFFYSLGSIIGLNDEKIKLKITDLLNVNLIMLSVGLILHFTRPEFFLQFQHNALGELYLYYGGNYPRLTSYIGNSMIIGIISSTSFILTLEYINNSYKKYFYLIVFLAGTILSLQRGAWLSLFLGLLIYALLYIKKHGLVLKRKSLIRLTFATPFILVPAVIFIIKFFDFAQLLNRLSSIGNALVERMGTWNHAFFILKENIFGAGLGMLSHKSASLGFEYSIPDANYFRIAGEIGIFGFLIFIFLVIISLYISYKKRMLSIFTVLIIFYFQAIGTNVFDLYYCSFIFWLILGITYSKAK